MNERAPQHIQNIIIREFCKRENLHYNLSAVEYAMDSCYKTLHQLIYDLSCGYIKTFPEKFCVV